MREGLKSGRSRADGWGVSAHPESEHRVWVDDPPEYVGPKRGLLRLRLGKRGSGGTRRNDAYDRWIYPGTPVVLVDGVPTIEGFGTAWLRLPVGHHDIEIQAGGSRGWWRVEITEGATAELDSVCSLDEHANSGRRWVLGPPGLKFVDRYWPALLWVFPSLIAANLVVLVPANMLELRPFGTVFGVWLAVFGLVWLLAAGQQVRRVAKSVRTKRDQPAQELTAEPPLPAPAFIAPVHAFEQPELPEGLGMLVLDLRWELVWQRLDSPEGTGLLEMDAYGEPVASKARPWIEPPTLLVDDHLVDARWARLCLPMPPGQRQIDIAVPRWTSGEADDYVTLVEVVEVEAGALAHCRVTAEVVQHLRGGAYALEVLDLAAEPLGRRRGAQLRPYAAPRPPLRRMDGEDRSHRGYSIADRPQSGAR